MKITNVRVGATAQSDEAKLAEAVLDGYLDHHDEIPEGTRIVVIVATGEDGGRIGCAVDGYEEDERLMLDLSLLVRGVDLGAK